MLVESQKKGFSTVPKELVEDEDIKLKSLGSVEDAPLRSLLIDIPLDAPPPDDR